MKLFKDNQGRSVRLTDERLNHLETQRPEMVDQLNRISETLTVPDRIIRSKTDITVELFYKHYENAPVSEKILCVVVKKAQNDTFIVTAYYTDTIKRGKVLWEKK